jgi:hypothetical protein
MSGSFRVTLQPADWDRALAAGFDALVGKPGEVEEITRRLP